MTREDVLAVVVKHLANAVDGLDTASIDPTRSLKEYGAKYTKALRPMAEKVVVDGNLVTGQNPMSATGVAEKVVKLLRKRG